MKKLMVSIMAIGIVGLASTSMACYTSSCTGFGELDIESFSYGGGYSGDFYTIDGGYAIGAGSSMGGAMGYGDGYVKNGDVTGDVTTVGGGFSNTEGFTGTDFVGSATNNYGITGGSLDLSVESGKNGYGYADGFVGGSVYQGSANSSELEFTGSGWNSDGFTSGSASQGSNGWFMGGVDIYSGSKSEAGGGVEFEIVTDGGSFTESWRQDDGATQGMGTRVGAYTNITSSVDSYKYTDGNDATASLYTKGGLDAAGMATTATTQYNNNGYAGSNATGYYSMDDCDLGSNYSGSAEGYSYTAMTTGIGNGVISQAGSGMSVSSRIITN